MGRDGTRRIDENVDGYAGRYVDTYELCRLGAEISGSMALRGLRRLLSDLPRQADTRVEWSVRGEKNAAGLAFLNVRVGATLSLECQRCLEPLAWPVDARNRLQLVPESALETDSHEPDGEEDLVERIAESRQLDVRALVEDELILSLPYVPKHDVCPSMPMSDETDADTGVTRPSPFSVLGKLKN